VSPGVVRSMAKDVKHIYKEIVEEAFPARLTISFTEGANTSQSLVYEKVTWDIQGERRGLRYGENPGQPAALYRLINGNLVLGDVASITPGKYLVSDAELLQSGKHPGKINLTDADNALNILRYFHHVPTVAIMKHNNPCGVASAESLEEAYRKAYRADRVAAFGGCIAVNRSVDMATAEAIASHYAEVVVAPEFDQGVMGLFEKKKNLRVMRIRNMERLHEYVGQRYLDFKSLVDGGLIVQWSYETRVRSRSDLALASCTYKGKEYRIQRSPTEEEYEDMLFGWFVETGITSNSVIYVKNRVTVGIGTGEQDRVGVAEIARDKAYRKRADWLCYSEYGIPYNDLEDRDKRSEIDRKVALEKGGLLGAVMVSDAFFPFRDGVEVGLREGVTGVVQPGGSERDFESIEACNEAGATMVFTGDRCFRH
jgi:phosphoribosylaminoimidazolecarboxamide formyltransferase/IMP cyclohydrolase